MVMRPPYGYESRKHAYRLIFPEPPLTVTVSLNTNMSFRSKLVGTWRLLSVNVVDSDGIELAQLSGEDSQGSLIYSTDGYMTSLLSSPEVTPWEKWNEPSPEEALKAGKLVYAYTGKFFLNEVPGNKQLVFHEIRVSMPPNMAGSTQKRNVEITEADPFALMTIKVDNEVEIQDRKGYLVLDWRKEQRNDATTPEAVVEPLGGR